MRGRHQSNFNKLITNLLSGVAGWAGLAADKHLISIRFTFTGYYLGCVSGGVGGARNVVTS